MKPIKGSINVNKIDKERLFDGKKGLYLDIVLVPTPKSAYGDYMIVQDTEKDEESIILGNARLPKEKEQVEKKDDLPF